MSKITEMMIRKPSLKYRDVRNYEGELLFHILGSDIVL